MKKCKFILVILSLILILSTGCSNSNGNAKESSAEELNAVEKIKASGKIVLGTSADFPPNEFHKNINGVDTIVGYDIEIAKEIAKDLGVELEIKDMRFDGLLAALNTNKVDFVLAGMTPTEERKQSVDFSKVYNYGEQCIVIKAENKEKYTSNEDLAGKIIGVQKGAIQEKIAKNQLPDSTPKGLGKVTDLVLLINNDKADAIIIPKDVAISYVKENPQLAISSIKVENTYEGSAVAIKKGNTQLVNEINKTIDRLVEKDMIKKFIADAKALAKEN
ncbi:transporter substrate-binding domain-containing protein [Clostridiisalibacter paucivorans]|uniref:transporter substrate-binding domain-containing protein n=1 Tax=Clostridiisalibacter paucivorans TaxID=408753 RepID=UPI00047DB546|nr:transporter substrate-binding domain-containing protein [Clostridiisalibacter paucivorans]